MRCAWCGVLWLASCTNVPSTTLDADVAVRPPNVILILTDDQGWSDVGVQGARGFSTPHLDRLAREGVRFTDFYAAQPVCSPSRAALLTGCYPNRLGILGALGPADRHGLAESETTLAELCRARGYATALIGKWHLGRLPAFSPLRHGFERFHGLPYSHDMWPFHPESPAVWGDVPLYDQESVVALDADPACYTREFTDHALEFVRDSHAADRPFFLYLAHPLPHVPLAASDAFRGRSERGLYGDVVEELDHSVGRLLALLDELALADDTLVIFTSDNGPWLSYGDHAGSADGLREGKGTVFEGGVRVPFLARWPKRIPAGSVCRLPAMNIDVFPTVERLLREHAEPDASIEPGLEIDGRDLSPWLFGAAETKAPHDALFFWYGGELQAVRAGDWKLHLPHTYRSMEGRASGGGGVPGLYDYDRRIGLALFDLANDPGETRDVAASNPEVVARLSALAGEARGALGDTLTGVAGCDRREPGLEH